MNIQYKMKGFHPNEYFKVLINGKRQYSTNKDTISQKESDNNFVLF